MRDIRRKEKNNRNKTETKEDVSEMREMAEKKERRGGDSSQDGRIIKNSSVTELSLQVSSQPDLGTPRRSLLILLTLEARRWRNFPYIRNF